MARRWWGAVVAAGVLVVVAGPASACDSPPPPPAVAAAEADAIFAGTATASDARDGSLHVTIAVDRVWEGEATETTRVTTHADAAACGYPFEEGGSYLVYALEQEGELTTRLVDGTRRVAGAEEDLEVLGTADRPAPDPPRDAPLLPIAVAVVAVGGALVGVVVVRRR